MRELRYQPSIHDHTQNDHRRCGSVMAVRRLDAAGLVDIKKMHRENLCTRVMQRQYHI